MIDRSLFEPDVVKLLDLLESEAWPEAAPDFIICHTEEDKIDRADGIVHSLLPSFGSKFLDFGCGEGHIPVEVSKLEGKQPLGYDVQVEGIPWSKVDFLTTDFEVVKSNAPYDFVLLYDVLDHVDDPVAVLNQVKSVSHENTDIFVRCHPWIGRHAGHLYGKLNKAWIHVVFTDEELEKMGLVPDVVQKVITPVNQQKKWFSQAGLKIKREEVIRDKVEDFFRTTEIAERLPKIEKGKFPEWQMSQSFNDYVLTQ